METAPDSMATSIAIEGELTIFTVQDWKARLLPLLDEHPALTVDLAAVTEFDSAGLQLLAVLRQEGTLRGRGIVLRNPAEAVAAVLAQYRMEL
jgi:anti-anti-sigma factor